VHPQQVCRWHQAERCSWHARRTGCHPEGPGQAQEQAFVNHMRFNKAKCKVLHLGRGNPHYQCRLGDEGTDSSPAKKDLGVLVDEKLDMSCQSALAAQKANWYPGLHQKKRGQQVEGSDPATLLCSGETPPGVLCPALEPPAQEGHGTVGAGPEEATKMIRGLEHLSCEDRLREFRLFSLEKRRPWGGLIAAFHYLKGAYNRWGQAF